MDDVSLKDSKGKELKVQWKAVKADELEVTIPVESAKVSGGVTIAVKQAGIKDDEQVPVQIYGEAGQLKQLKIIPGDARAVLQGTHLDEVESVELNGVQFTHKTDPANKDTQWNSELELAAANASATASLTPGDKLTAQVKLKDGRSLQVPVLVESPHPRVTLLTKAVELGAASKSSAIHLANPDELPQDARVSFSVKTEIPATFPRNEKIEVATKDYSFHVLLGIEDGALTLQDPQTAVVHFDPAKSFGNSAFGPLQVRPVDERGVQGDWVPLVTLVRVPSLQELDCPDDINQQCTLKGKNLFLLAAVSADAQFSHAASVPQGFVSETLKIPRPVNGAFYVKLRDDPSDVNTASLPMPDQKQSQPQTPPSSPR